MMFLVQPFLSIAASASPQPKSFEAWCRQRKSVPGSTRYTIDVLLEKAGTKDCKLADRQLKTLTNLSLGFSHQISDVKPLAGLTNLRVLDFRANPLVKPLPGSIDIKVCPLKPESICKF